MDLYSLPTPVPYLIPPEPRPQPQLPTPTELQLRQLELSETEREGAEFIRLIDRLEFELRETEDPQRFMELHGQLLECQRIAKDRFEQTERIADIWRGADFNLGMFLSGLGPARIQRMREQAAEAAAQQEQMRRSMEEAAEHQRQFIAGVTAAAATPITEELYSFPSGAASITFPMEPALPTSLPELIARVDNEAQKQALSKLLLRNEANQMYLSSYEANTTLRGRGSDLEGTFEVLGTMRHGSRESYSVKWYKWSIGKPAFWCNCPDHKFNSARKNIVCKHICFLVTKVGRILDPAFFGTQRHMFTREQQERFRQAVGNAAIFADGARERERLATAPVRTVTFAYVPTATAVASHDTRRAQFFEQRRPVEAEDSCPICYDEMTGTTCLSCPTCSNNVHRDCMEVWLERHSTCVFCRSDVWRSWTRP